jgi:hypothetical protein
MGALRLSLSLVVTHLSLCLTLPSCDFHIWLLSLLRSVRLVLSVFVAPLRYSVLPPVYPSPLRSVAFFQWGDSVDGVEPPPALNLHLLLSLSFFQRSCVSPKLSVVRRRLFRIVRVLALSIVGWRLLLEYRTLCM